jgi:hypothetical protein
MKGIGLESTKVQIERGRVVVDEFCRTHEASASPRSSAVVAPVTMRAASNTRLCRTLKPWKPSSS